MCYEVKERLGSKGGAAAVKQHPFFEGIEWDKLKEMEAPFVPNVTDLDT